MFRGKYAVTIRFDVRRMFRDNIGCKRRICSGAPGAVQVADRFHLLQNLAHTLEVALMPHAGALRRMGMTGGEATAIVSETPAIQPSQVTIRAAHAAERRRLERHDAVWSMHCQGWRVGDIAARIGISRATVGRHLRDQAPLPACACRRLGSGAMLIMPWRQVIADHWVPENAPGASRPSAQAVTIRLTLTTVTRKQKCKSPDVRIIRYPRLPRSRARAGSNKRRCDGL